MKTLPRERVKVSMKMREWRDRKDSGEFEAVGLFDPERVVLSESLGVAASQVEAAIAV